MFDMPVAVKRFITSVCSMVYVYAGRILLRTSRMDLTVKSLRLYFSVARLCVPSARYSSRFDLLASPIVTSGLVIESCCISLETSIVRI